MIRGPRSMPIGRIGGDLHALALTIKRRAANRAAYTRERVLVTVSHGAVHAVGETTATAQLAKPESIVGVYTETAAIGDIADDLESWVASEQAGERRAA